jgi:hypothetical protein
LYRHDRQRKSPRLAPAHEQSCSYAIRCSLTRGFDWVVWPPLFNDRRHRWRSRQPRKSA